MVAHPRASLASRTHQRFPKRARTAAATSSRAAARARKNSRSCSCGDARRASASSRRARGAAQQDLSAAHDPRLRSRPTTSATRCEETAARLKKKTRSQRIGRRRSRAGSTSTSSTAAIVRLRDDGRHLFPAEQTIRSIKLYHRQIYGYAFHRPKLELRAPRRRSTTSGPATRASHRSPIFSKQSRLICPHDLFRARTIRRRAHRKRIQNSPTSRASSSTARRTRRRTSPRSSSRPSATTSCVTRRCSASCSPTTA